MLNKELLEIVCCPKCHGDLMYEPDGTGPEARNGTLTCKACGTVYQVIDDIPILLIDEESDPAE